jgi:CheY-like chemotaxis protein/HPt (histidine-containing phosphotransfer) domain-containing protein
MVDDTGTGIPEDKLEDIFLKFTQADESTTRRFGGTGLGLTICKRLVEMMGGEIGVQSVIGQGSSFWFVLPIQEAKIETINRPHNADRNDLTRWKFSNAHVLVVDDHPINLMFARKLLKKMGIDRVQMVDNGQEAFEYTQVTMYDAILMDCQMPGMDGFQTTEAIRKMHKGNNLHTPIIAVTANAMKGDREKCLAAGMDDYLSKPIDPQSLGEVLAKWIKTNDDNDMSEETSIEPIETEAEIKILTDHHTKEPPIDMAKLRSIFDGGAEEEQELFEIFMTSAKDCVLNMQNALQANDEELWRKAAHKLKGSASNIRAAQLTEFCAEAEKNFNASEKDKCDYLNKIKSALNDVEIFIQAKVTEHA